MIIVEPYERSNVEAVTEITDRYVKYSVRLKDDKSVIWEEVVNFSYDRSRRPGGLAFKAAAKRQDRIAKNPAIISHKSDGV